MWHLLTEATVAVVACLAPSPVAWRVAIAQAPGSAGPGLLGIQAAGRGMAHGVEEIPGRPVALYRPELDRWQLSAAEKDVAFLLLKG